MTWDEESVLAAVETVGFGGALWILHLACNSGVGAAKTSNFHVEDSSVKSYAKEWGLDEPSDPIIKEGYKNISRKTVVDADQNRGVINNRDKPEIVRLSSLGVSLAKTIDSDEQVRKTLQANLGMDVDEPQDPWWPGDGPDELYAVYLRTFADRSVLDEDEAEIEAIASLECLRCGEEVEDEYILVLTDGQIVQGWSRFEEVDCDNCGLSLKYCVADPHRKPEIV